MTRHGYFGRVSRSGRLALLLAACAWAQEPPSFKSEVGLVNVAMTVRDANGALVADLARDDVEVFEDGVPQSIFVFARSADIPLTLGLVVDVSVSQMRFFGHHQQDVHDFLQAVLRPQDRAFLLSFDNDVRLLADFSANPEPLLAGLKRYQTGVRAFPMLGPVEDRRGGTAFYDGIFHGAEKLFFVTNQGRKALLVFSDGEDNSSVHHMLDAIEGPQRANASVYCIRYTEVKEGALNARNKYGIRVMARISRDTGARDFDAQLVQLRTVFGQIGEELRSSYELAYHTTNPVRDGSFRKITVRAKRAGLRVRAKTGYVAR